MINYNEDVMLSGTAVSIASLRGRQVTLTEAVTTVEQQTSLRFVYDADRLPMGANVYLGMGEGESRTLAQLFEEISSQVAVVFKRRNGLIAVWGKGPDDVIVRGETAQQPDTVIAGEAHGTIGEGGIANAAEPAATEAPPQAQPREMATDPAPATGLPPIEAAARPSDVFQLDKLQVQGETVKGSSADLSSMRQKAEVAVDFLTADQFAKYSAGDLAEVVLRMPGVSVAGGQYAVVRGLSDRFLSTTLNGLKLPSPDPEKQAFQLDLVPTSAVEALVVSKSFEAGLWAESTGGAMNILTRTIPGESHTSVSVGLKVNDNLYDGRLDYPIRDKVLDERFGFGSKARLPRGSDDPTWQYVPMRKSSVPLGTSVSVEHADIIRINDEQQIGVLLAFANSSSYATEDGAYAERGASRGQRPTPATSTTPALPGVPSDFEKEEPLPSQVQWVSDYTSSTAEYNTSVMLGLGYQLSENHAFNFNSLWVQTGNDQSYVAQTSTVTDPDTGETSLAFPVGPPYNAFPGYSFLRANEYFRERNLTVFQFSGEHKFPVLGDPGLTWAVQRAVASQKDHPFTEVEYVTPLADLNGSYEVLDGNDAPTPITAVWGDNEEVQNTARLDAKWAIDNWTSRKVEVSVGAAIEKSDRNTTGVGLIYNKPGAAVTARTPNEAVTKTAQVGGEFNSASAAGREIRAAYVQVSLPVHDNITLVAGARHENYRFAVSGTGVWGIFDTDSLYNPDSGAGRFGKFLGTTGPNNPPFSSDKLYPGAALKWDILDSLTLRLAYSQTQGRPSFREVSPLFTKSVYTGNLVVGNAVLKPSEAVNYDARLEWKPNEGTLLAVSYFRKDIRNPIEKFLLDTRSVASYFTEIFVNNPGEAALAGYEVEFRHDLGTWSEIFRSFSFGMNFTHIDAEVSEHPIAVLNASDHFQDPAKMALTRRLYDQPEYIANVDLTWQNAATGTRVTLAAYAISDTLTTASLQSFRFDTYERDYKTYDLIVSQSLPRGLKLKLAVKNLNDPIRGTIYDPAATAEIVPIREYRAGRDYSLSLEANF